MGQALLDLKSASELAPSDKAVAAELKRVRALAKEKGIDEASLKPKAPERAASSSSSTSTSASTPGVPQFRKPGSSSSAPATSPDMSKAMEEMQKRPQLMSQAAEMMKNMSPDDLQKMMPGVDPVAAKRLSENPEMLKQSMEMMNAMPEEQRKRIMEQAASMRANGTAPTMGANGMPDMSSMSSMFSNPDMMSSMADMAAKQEGVDPEQAKMMKEVSEQMKSNPELGKQMSEMMKTMPPEQMEEMMKMSKSMKGGQGGSGGGMAPGQTPSMDAMLNNPDMMEGVHTEPRYCTACGIMGAVMYASQKKGNNRDPASA